MNDQIFYDLVFHGREERNLEYKSDIKWENAEIKAKLTKTILSMCNIRDGGVIIIGVTEKDETFEPTGITEENFNSFKQDDISVYVNEFADPYVEVLVKRIELDSKKFIVIQIEEFPELPVICKKDGVEGLFRGTIYTRPRRKNESVKVPTQVEMREIIEMAVEKSQLKLQKSIRSSGYDIVSIDEKNKELFDKQLGEL